MHKVMTNFNVANVIKLNVKKEISRVIRTDVNLAFMMFFRSNTSKAWP